MGAVEQAIRARVRAGESLQTPSKGAPFEVARIDAEGVLLLLGEQQARTLLTWTCLEGIPAFLGRTWRPIGGVYATTADPTTLDGYLKRHVKRATAGWVAVMLERAGVVELDRRRPARVRLTSEFAVNLIDQRGAQSG